MEICENCGKEHDGSYGTGRFCNEKCARSFSTKGDKKETKWATCIDCGKDIEVKKRASPSLVKCDECKKNNESIKKKYCKICGQEKPCLRPDICKKHKLFPALSKYFGFDLSKKGTIDIYEEFDKVKNIVIEEYWGNGLSTTDLAEKYGHHHQGSFIKILQSLGLETRNLSQSMTLAWYDGKHNTKLVPSYSHGWHKTWNGKEVFYRSSYELDYAQWLDEQQIDYVMEDLRILYWDSQKQMQRVAIPDFYLPETNTIVEIKSNYFYDEQNMLDKHKEYKRHGYNFKLILEREEYKW